MKEIERAKKRLEARLQALVAEHKKDNTLTFEELGVDRLFVDEAHHFKNLFYLTKMTRIAGLPQTSSQRAFDMYLKVRHVQSLNGGGGVVFATGTPIANSMAEMFTMQRYLQPNELKKHNLHHFDSWAATFGEPVTAMELSPDGAGYRLNTRFARFINVPELMQMFRQSADVQTAAMLNLPRPKIEGEKSAICNAPATEKLKEYDLYGRATNKLDTASAPLFRYVYDPDGRLTNRWSPGTNVSTGITTRYAYDKVGNLTTVDYPNNQDLSFQYDRNNRLTNMSDAIGATTFGYSSVGTLTSEDGPWADDTLSYTYTSNRLRRTLALQQPNSSAWNQSYAYDAADRLTNVTSQAGAFGYQYQPGLEDAVDSPANLIQRLTLPNAAYIAFAFDGLGRVTETALKSSGNVVTNLHQYAYNVLDQRTKQTRTMADYVDYTYDSLGQLVSAMGKESGGASRWQEQLLYTFDVAGNLSNRVQNLQTNLFTVNSLNELTSVGRTTNKLTVAGTTSGVATNVTVNVNSGGASNAILYADNTFVRTNVTLTNGLNTIVAIGKDSSNRVDTSSLSVTLPATVSFAYDLNGNMCTNGTRILDYDDENQLVRVTEPSNWKSEFSYDAKLRRRVRTEFVWTNSAWATSQVVRYVYDGNVVVQERDQLNIPQITYTRGRDLSGSFEGAGGIGGLLALSQVATLSPQHFYYHSDANGNVTALISTNQQIAARYLYDPFGNTLSASGPVADVNLYRFSSKELHSPSSLVYYLYRFYDPNLQRWPNRDPIGERGGMNLYRFVGNSPVRRIDPVGLDDKWAGLKDNIAMIQQARDWFSQVQAAVDRGKPKPCSSICSTDLPLRKRPKR